MIHRTNMHSINVDEPPEKVDRQRACHAPTRRTPLWEREPENIVGIVHAKDLLRALTAPGGDASKVDISAIAAKPWFVPETTSLNDQLNAFLKRKAHFALVVDEYGDVQGLVTLEDIIEEIVGDIADEYDVAVQGVRRQPDGSVNVRRRGADPRSQPRHGLEPARRRGNDHRRPRHPRGAHHPRARPGLHLPRLPLPGAAPVTATASRRSGSCRSRAARHRRHLLRQHRARG